MKYHIGKTIIEGIEYRKCRVCREIKILNEDNFVKRNTENGWRGACRICHNKNKRVREELTKNEKIRYKRYRDKKKKTHPFPFLIRSTKGNSKKVGREFNITLENIEYLWKIQNQKCYYTNRIMRFELGFPDSVSIDRIDSSIGYIPTNIVLCQKRVNIVKNDLSVEELLQFCTDVLNNFNNKQ